MNYCTSLECVCGENCHNNPDYHLTGTTWNGVYPQLQEGAVIDPDNLLGTALTTLLVEEEEEVMVLV